MKALILALLIWAAVLWQFMVGGIPAEAPSAQTPKAEISAPAEAGVLPVAENVPTLSTSSPPITSEVQVAGNTSPAKLEVGYSTDFTSLLEAAIHEGINKERVKNNLKELKYDALLADIARGHSADMAKDNYFAHTDNEGCDSACRLTGAKYQWQAVGENIFLMKSSYRQSVSDTAAVIVQGWMGSEGHRKNVLEKNFTYEGLGVVIQGDSIYATELFARPQ